MRRSRCRISAGAALVSVCPAFPAVAVAAAALIIGNAVADDSGTIRSGIRIYIKCTVTETADISLCRSAGSCASAAGNVFLTVTHTRICFFVSGSVKNFPSAGCVCCGTFAHPAIFSAGFSGSSQCIGVGTCRYVGRISVRALSRNTFSAGLSAGNAVGFQNISVGSFARFNRGVISVRAGRICTFAANAVA